MLVIDTGIIVWNCNWNKCNRTRP